MRHSAELDHLAHIMSGCADVLRTLGESQDHETQREFEGIVDMIERAARRLERLVEETALQ